MNEFFHKKIPVCNSVKEFKDFLAKHNGCKFCIYLACKDSKGWEKSTSRVYMNQIMNNLIYLPVNIKKGDDLFLKEIYNLAESNESILAINQTQPHKSNPVLIELLKNNSIINVDSLIKNKKGKFKPYDLNGTSFAGWFKNEVTQFRDKCVIILGVGGVGEPIARKIILEKPSKLILVDIIPKIELYKELSKNPRVEHASSLNKINLNKLKLNNKQIIFINCAGKEGANSTGVEELLKKFEGKNYVFVDLRPYLEVDLVSKAKDLGWRSYTGHGMNARNDYSLLAKITGLMDTKVISFKKFKELVVKAS